MEIKPNVFLKKYPVKHKFTMINGKKVHWVEFGSGKPLIGLHGLGGAWSDYWSLLPVIIKRKCYLVDLPGCGKSETISDMSVLGITLWLNEFSKRIKGRVLLESICSSSQIAILFEKKYPKKIEKQIMHMPIISGKFNKDAKINLLLILAILPNFVKKELKKILLPVFIGQIAENNETSIKESAELDKLNKKISDHRVYSEYYKNILQNDLRNEFMSNKRPSLILAMDQDDNLPLNELNKISKGKKIKIFSNVHSWNEKIVILQNKEVSKFL